MGIRISADGQDGMELARVEPQQWTKMPFSMGVAEYRLAPGQVLAIGVAGNNPMGKPLYLFSGTPDQEKRLPAIFKPAYAAALDLPIGDFTIRERPIDSTRQWAYKRSPLYTCDCDISTGDLNGRDTPGIAVATLLHYNVPPQVAIRKDSLAIGYMIEARTGKTLYYRDRLKDDYTPDHARPLGGTEDPGIGALLNLKHCDAQCEKEWHPLLAPKNVQPQGYWSTYLRPDGTRQWAYKNCALYTHATERPGTLDGNETYNINIEDYGKKNIPEEFGLGMMWRALVP
jgi:predicted lipoprotein with Yx(FWY)xxD motif